jgi:hypothetical protein
MGDCSFYRMMADLSAAKLPLVAVSGTPQDGLGEVGITQLGQSVLDGRADHVALSGIDRWLGGVHLKSDKVAWRWDVAARRIVRL